MCEIIVINDTFVSKLWLALKAQKYSEGHEQGCVTFVFKLSGQ